MGKGKREQKEKDSLPKKFAEFESDNNDGGSLCFWGWIGVVAYSLKESILLW
jgi:hypothetical protein